MNAKAKILTCQPPASGLVLVDCDEVLLAWHRTFYIWATTIKGIRLNGPEPLAYDLKGWLPDEMSDSAVDLINEFTASADSGFGEIQPLEGAADFLGGIRAAGMRVRVITACSTDPAIMRRRCDNLEAVFPGAVFDDIAFVALGASKTDELARHPASWWFDDLPKHVIAGNALGHQGFVVSSGHNIAIRATGQHNDLIWIDRLSDMLPCLRRETDLLPSI